MSHYVGILITICFVSLESCNEYRTKMTKKYRWLRASMQACNWNTLGCDAHVCREMLTCFEKWIEVSLNSCNVWEEDMVFTRIQWNFIKLFCRITQDMLELCNLCTYFGCCLSFHVGVCVCVLIQLSVLCYVNCGTVVNIVTICVWLIAGSLKRIYTLGADIAAVVAAVAFFFVFVLDVDFGVVCICY